MPLVRTSTDRDAARLDKKAFVAPYLSPPSSCAGRQGSGVGCMRLAAGAAGTVHLEEEVGESVLDLDILRGCVG